MKMPCSFRVLTLVKSAVALGILVMSTGSNTAFGLLNPPSALNSHLENTCQNKERNTVSDVVMISSRVSEDGVAGGADGVGNVAAVYTAIISADG